MAKQQLPRQTRTRQPKDKSPEKQPEPKSAEPVPVENVVPTEETPVEFHPAPKDTDFIDWSPILDKMNVEVARNLIDVLQQKYPELKPILQFTTIPSDMILVNKKLFFETMSALVKGYTHGFTSGPAISKFAKMLGAKDRKEELALWDESQKYLKVCK